MTAHLQLSLFGAVRALRPDGTEVSFHSDKARVLLAYLVLEASAEPVLRSHLIQLFWPGFSPDSARNNLRVTLYRLRQSLAPFELIESNSKSVHFRADHPDFWCDALQAQSSPAQNAPWASFLHGYDWDDFPALRAWIVQRRAGPQSTVTALRAEKEAVQVDWGDIPAPAALVGRDQEMAQLHEWVMGGRAKVVGIFGMGGQGKSVLAAQFVRAVVAPPKAASAKR